jgi:hypothetical protein
MGLVVLELENPLAVSEWNQLMTVRKELPLQISIPVICEFAK